MSAITSMSRNVMSDSDTELVRYLLEINNVQDVPSVRQIKLIKERLRKLCSVRTIEYKGSLGNLYYVNSLADIIRQVRLLNP